MSGGTREELLTVHTRIATYVREDVPQRRKGVSSPPALPSHNPQQPPNMLLPQCFQRARGGKGGLSFSPAYRLCFAQNAEQAGPDRRRLCWSLGLCEGLVGARRERRIGRRAARWEEVAPSQKRGRAKQRGRNSN